MERSALNRPDAHVRRGGTSKGWRRDGNTGKEASRRTIRKARSSQNHAVQHGIGAHLSSGTRLCSASSFSGRKHQTTTATNPNHGIAKSLHRHTQKRRTDARDHTSGTQDKTDAHGFHLQHAPTDRDATDTKQRLRALFRGQLACAAQGNLAFKVPHHAHPARLVARTRCSLPSAVRACMEYGRSHFRSHRCSIAGIHVKQVHVGGIEDVEKMHPLYLFVLWQLQG